MTLRYPHIIALMLCLIICIGTGVQAAPQQKVNSDALIDELQKDSPKTDAMTLVWWTPDEYWQFALAEDGDISEAEIKEVVDMIHPYIVFLVVDGTIGNFGGVKYKSDSEVRNSLRIKDLKGNIYAPLANDKVDADLVNLYSVMQPMFEGMLGPMGKNMRPYFFSNKDKEGKRIADAKVPGSLTVMVGKDEYKWKLPLASLTPPKTCPKCSEKLNGTYNFCPWDGEKLPETKK